MLHTVDLHGPEYSSDRIIEPPSVHVAIPRGKRVKPPTFPPTRQFSFGESRYGLGLTSVVIEGREIRIYDREKTICDAIRFRGPLGQDVVNESVRNYLRAPHTDIDRIMAYSRLLGEEGPVQAHLRISA